MGWLDKALSAPGDAVKAATEAVFRLPAVPLDIADKAVQGAEDGIDKVVGEK